MSETKINPKALIPYIPQVVPDGKYSSQGMGRSIVEHKVLINLPSIVDAMVRASQGYYAEESVPIKRKGEVIGYATKKVYQKPDMRAAEYLVNQIAGKPTEVVEHRGRVNFVMDE